MTERKKVKGTRLWCNTILIKFQANVPIKPCSRRGYSPCKNQQADLKTEKAKFQHQLREPDNLESKREH